MLEMLRNDIIYVNNMVNANFKASLYSTKFEFAQVRVELNASLTVSTLLIFEK